MHPKLKIALTHDHALLWWGWFQHHAVIRGWRSIYCLVGRPSKQGTVARLQSPQPEQSSKTAWSAV